MAGGGSPRQKLINMMYLVLTALLALNVSKDILDSFITVNNGLEITKLSFAGKMNETYATFAGLAQSSEKYAPAYAEAQKIQKEANDIINYIDTIKVRAITVTEGLPLDSVVIAPGVLMNLEKVAGKDKYDAFTNQMIGESAATPREDEYSAKALRAKLEGFRDLVKGMSPDNLKLQASADQIFDFSDRKDASGTMNNWESINFYHVPLVAGVTILSKMQSDVRNLENEVVTTMMGNVEKSSFKFNTLEAIVKPRSSYVTVGSKYTAEIFLGAYDDQNAPEVWVALPGGKVDTAKKEIVGPSKKLDNIGSKAILEEVASGAGLRTVSGIIKFTPAGGETTVQPFSTEYEVAAPSLVVSPTKMNVFYRGLDNPVSISVAGYSDKDIAPSVTNGTLSKAASGYIVKPGAGQTATVNVTVTNPDGSKKPMNGVEFRVKNVPNPTPVFAGKGIADQSAKKTELMAAQGVIARMENFEFELRFDVVEYTVSAVLSGNLVEETVRGAALSAKAKDIITKVRTGQKVNIDNIKAKGPAGDIRSIGNLSFKVL